jgi:D-arabinose 1-dehydrogenase-like Zn-dependent alcohol dehydrogenase
MSTTDELPPADADRDLKRRQFQEALKRIHENSIKNGTATMSLDDINAVIADYRRERRAKRERKS